MSKEWREAVGAAAGFIAKIVFTLMMTIAAGAEERESTVVIHQLTAPECEALDERLDRILQDEIYMMAAERFPQDLAERNRYYASIIGLIEGESEFNHKARNGENSDGTTDHGLFQINSFWVWRLKRMGYIEREGDLYDPHISIKCGEYIWYRCYEKTGWSEKSYTWYLYGKDHKETKKTRRVWDIQKGWYEEIYGKESKGERAAGK